MTKSDVVDAFIRGDLDRRGFIKRLTAVGVSSAAAMAYAGSLVQSTAAAPSTGSGFITRGFMQDAEYGSTVTAEELPAALEATSELNEETSAEMAALDQYSAEDYEEAGLEASDQETMQDMQSQQQEQSEAFEAYSAAALGPRRSVNAFAGSSTLTRRSASRAQDSDHPLVQTITRIAELLNVSASVYTALIPAIEDTEGRLLISQIATAVGRHAATASGIVGLDPIPGAFEEPINPLNVDPEDVG